MLFFHWIHFIVKQVLGASRHGHFPPIRMKGAIGPGRGRGAGRVELLRCFGMAEGRRRQHERIVYKKRNGHGGGSGGVGCCYSSCHLVGYPYAVCSMASAVECVAKIL